MTRVCSKCDIEKPIESFNKNISSKSPDKRYSFCKECANTLARERYKTKDKFQYTKRMYGLDKEDILALVNEQEYKCRLCDKEFELYSPNSKRQFAVDHCHTTNKVRGLLCHHCNIGLGMFKDNITTLERAIKYLDESK